VVVALLDHYGLLLRLQDLLAPVANLAGLQGDAVLPLLAGITVNLYAALGAAAALDLSVREITILGTMLGICHSLILEGVIAHKSGAHVAWVTALRLFAGLLAGIFLNLVWR